MDKVLTVSQLGKYIKGVFEDELILHNISVTGEVSDFKVSSSNTYIVLKDLESVLNCYKPATTETIEIGTKVIVTGTVSYFQKSGRLSFIFSDVKPYGQGELYSDFLKLKDKLSKEGLFSRKRNLPKFIKSVALLTSSEGAAIHDFLKVLSPQPFIQVDVFHSKVQGELAATELIASLNEVKKSFENYDLVVITRGGGGAIDLSVFNDEFLVRAVYDCPIPVISAVGHEVDYTLCDFCADLRVGTPSMAGEHIISVNRQILSEFYFTLDRLIAVMDRKLSSRVSALNTVYMRDLLAGNELQNKARNSLSRAIDLLNDNAFDKFTDKKSLLDDTLKHIDGNINEIINLNENKFQIVQTKLNALNPSAVLQMGYAKVLSGSKEVFFDQVQEGDRLEVAMCGGSFDAQVLKVNRR